MGEREKVGREGEREREGGAERGEDKAREGEKGRVR